MKVGLTFYQVRDLLDVAVRNGTQDAWAKCALEWMEAAQTEIERLQELLRQAKE